MDYNGRSHHCCKPNTRVAKANGFEGDRFGRRVAAAIATIQPPLG